MASSSGTGHDAAKAFELGPQGWIEATPLPYTSLFWVRCDCGQRFFGWPKFGWMAPRVRRYKKHWLTHHRPTLNPYA